MDVSSVIIGDIDNFKSVNDTYGHSCGDFVLHITMTFGIAFCEEQTDIEKLITLADERLYYGKKHGKNQIVDTGMYDAN